MAGILKGYEPEALWRYFEEISAIPRPSGHEKAASDYMVGIAKKLGLEYEQDENNNVVIRKPATKGREKDTPVVLQGHLDMVPEKNKDKVFDFEKDGIQLMIDGDWLTADGTTLGGDNGVALAAALAVLESKDISHPPLEALFTTEEETGLTGAMTLKPGFVKGKILLNIDSEEEGVVFIGCAGGTDTTGRIKIDWKDAPKEYEPHLLFVSGLKGGHSGLEINQQRGDAIRIIARVLWHLDHELKIGIASIIGGSKRNAIPRETESVIYIPKGKLDEAKKIVKRVFDDIYKEIKTQDPGLKIEIMDVESKPDGKVYSDKFKDQLFKLLYAIPHGVLEMSKDIEGLVQTSTNLAIISHQDKDTLMIQTSQRSSIESSKVFHASQVESIMLLAGMNVKHENAYPAWTPNVDSAILKVAKKVWKDTRGSELDVQAIHAGLECGIIGEKYEGMDMISFGPNMHDVHSPDERLNIPSSQRVFDYLVDLLKAIK
ncbi:MAG: aminoacyl-histidine dipeptidase [Acidobacteria bacterium]|nr:aminoacyl-histidine dipeptidase [Acidobacteriota bacterium]